VIAQVKTPASRACKTGFINVAAERRA